MMLGLTNFANSWIRDWSHQYNVVTMQVSQRGHYCNYERVKALYDPKAVHAIQIKVQGRN